MNEKSAFSTTLRRVETGLPLYFNLALVIIFFTVSAALSYFNIRTLEQNARRVSHTYEVILTLEDILSLLKDAETGQRGFILTGNESYLEPYTASLNRLDGRLSDIERLTADDQDFQAQIPQLKDVISSKRAELAQTIAVRRTQGFEAARTIVLSDRGRLAMEFLRSHVNQMQQYERRLLTQRFAQTDSAFQKAVWGIALSGVLGITLSALIAYLMRRALFTRQRHEWLQFGQTQLNAKMGGEQTVDELGGNVLRFLCEYMEAPVGAIFVQDEGFFRKVSSYALPDEANLLKRFVAGEGLLGQAVKDARPFVVEKVPEGYLTISSALGKKSPARLLIAPAIVDGAVNAVVELGFFPRTGKPDTEFLARVSESIGVAMRSAKYRVRLQELLEETQRQAEEVQAQSEELRVSNEELEEQGKALKESQAHLEAQQVEMEQTNSQLEEQARTLEVQTDDLSRAKESLEQQARALEQASRYKTDFLANMSHELRTPLNSSLILAKLLSDNREGNLTSEQVKYAQTILAAGNDLLILINDVLDLAKVEAGHMEVKPDTVEVARLIQSLRNTFEPIAKQKGLLLRMSAAPGAPESLITDAQRLEQVLKNFLSNSLKFTAQGEIEVEVSRAADGRIAFAVRDTGIGIPADKQQMIFEPFNQADDTTNRKYGGTGLGLSISRELVRLLGGEIHLASEIGRGSTFTILLPEVYTPRSETEPLPIIANAKGRSNPATMGKSSGANGKSDQTTVPLRNATSKAERMADDREILMGNGRVILVVEDDQSFARIVSDLAHEMDFQALIANNAEEAVILTQQYLPAAVVLDIGLPDNSGLFVLERIKRNSRTRHIPVHVVSASDYSEMAQALGALSYMLKPVKREQLVAAFQKLETRLVQKLRRVLVVEDDKVQLESMQHLLGSSEVEVIGASTAAECLEKLKSTTYDCMVLDLTLPDAPGFSLLETLSTQEDYAFPPVIVYTGRELSSTEEQKLRKYSKSIIIKGAKSPERLLDEVTLFLHQVVSELPPDQQKMLAEAQSREDSLAGRRVLIVEDDVRNIFALTSLLEPRGAKLEIARNGREAINILERTTRDSVPIDLVLMDIMMPEMDGLTAMREIRKRSEWKKLPIIALTAKAMKDDQEQAFAAGANDYLAKPLDVDKLLSLIRVWVLR